MAETHPHEKILVHNPSDWVRSSVVQVEIPKDIPFRNLQVYNELGEEISSQLGSAVSEKGTPISFIAENMSAYEDRIYYLRPRVRNAPFHLPEEGLLDGNDFYLENDAMRAIFEENGHLTLMVRNPPTQQYGSDQKIIAMGEELSEGSIWAADSFFKFYGLCIPILHGVPLKPRTTSKLIEASDFQGKLRLEFHEKSPKTSSFEISVVATIEKGESPRVSLAINPNKSLSIGDLGDLKLSFEGNIRKDMKISGDNYVGIYDRSQQQGLILISDAIAERIEFYPEKPRSYNLSFSIKNRFNPSFFSFAIFPINKGVIVNGTIDKKEIEKLEFDYFHPFEVQTFF